MAVAAFERPGSLGSTEDRPLDLLRFSTAGSVDDGKSTLTGRLLYETKQIFDDQLEAIARVSRRQSVDYLNLALLTDGLRAEREQGITIDVAYRYFATRRRKFIIADTPGHAQYTRNMVTGASTADLALILVDARKGVVEQTRRHALLAALLGVPTLLVCVNKMDLVDYAAQAYEDVRGDFLALTRDLDVAQVAFVPVSALNGDNVVEGSPRMPWYDGPSLLHFLEEAPAAGCQQALTDLRFPVQWVVRPLPDGYHDYRGYAGQLAGGVVRTGDQVLVLPAAVTTHVTDIDTFDGPLQSASPPQNVTLRLQDDLDISRGSIVCSPQRPPQAVQELNVALSWFGNVPLQAGTTFSLMHTTRGVRAVVTGLTDVLDVHTLHRDTAASKLGLNEIGRATIRTSQPLFVDSYRSSRATGSFILIDDATNNTVAAGMVL